MDYGSLLRRSFDIAWKYKTLWVLGFFAAAYGSFGEVFEHLPVKRSGWLESSHPQIADVVRDWVISAPGIITIVFLIGGLFLLALIFFVMHLISIGGLIGGVYQIEGDKGYTLKGLFKLGGQYFWRFLGLFFIFFCILGLFVILLISSLVLGIIIFKALALVLLLPLIPILFAGIFFFGTIYSLAQREIIANETPIFDAVSEGYNLLIRHLSANIIIFLVKMGLEIAILVAGTIIIAMCAIPFVLIGVSSIYVLIVLLLLVLPIFLLIMVVVEGFLGTFFNSLMTLFYLELRKLTPYKPKTRMNINPAESSS